MPAKVVGSRQRKSFDNLDKQMQDGYELQDEGKDVEAANFWEKTWELLLDLCDQLEVKTVAEFDEVFPGIQSAENWLQDYGMALWNAGLDDKAYMAKKLAVCEKLLARFPDDLREETGFGWRSDMADCLYELGEKEKAESLYRGWLEADPHWGWGWIHWAHLFSSGPKEGRNNARAEEILKQGLAVEGIKKEGELLDRLRTVLEHQNKTEEAAAIDAKIKDLEKSGKYKSPRTRREEGPKDDFMSKAILALAKQKPVRMDAAIPAKEATQAAKAMQTMNKVGRNDQCPCRSGKKFKKCCGRSLWAP